jgi:septal ring factor EnvC (AmiA/AmiB activator)
LLAQLVGEVKAGRELVEAQRAEIATLEKQLAAEKANSASLATSYQAAEREIEQLRRSVGFLERAITLNEQTIAVLKSDNERLKGEARKSRKRAVLATLAAGGMLAARVLGVF